MTVVRVDMYTIECDSCHITSGADSDYSAWNDESYARDEAMQSGWLRHEGKDYCPECYEYDDDDKIAIKNKTKGVEPNDVRIGNWFQDKATKEKFQVMQITRGSTMFDWVAKGKWQAEPIPITEDVLLASGYENTKPDGHYFIDEDNRVYHARAYRQNGWIVSYRAKDTTLRMKCKYLHELQNIHFIVTGEELEVKL